MSPSASHLTFRSFCVLVWVITGLGKRKGEGRKEITRSESDSVGKSHIFAGCVIQEEKLELCLVGNRAPLKGFTQEQCGFKKISLAAVCGWRSCCEVAGREPIKSLLQSPSKR